MGERMASSTHERLTIPFLLPRGHFSGNGKAAVSEEAATVGNKERRNASDDAHGVPIKRAFALIIGCFMGFCDQTSPLLEWGRFGVF